MLSPWVKTIFNKWAYYTNMEDMDSNRKWVIHGKNSNDATYIGNTSNDVSSLIVVW